MTGPSTSTDSTGTARCDYFVMCERPAAGVVVHPVAGPVAACERCARDAGLPLRQLMPSS